MRQRLMFWVPAVLLLMASILLGFSRSTQGAEACTNATFKGSYGGAGSGFLSANGFLYGVAAIGTFIADGQGNISGSSVSSVSGTFSRGTISGTYTVQPDCMGFLTATSNTGTSKGEFVLVERGRRVFIMGTDPGEVLITEAVRQ